MYGRAITGFNPYGPTRDNRVYYLLDMCSAHNYGPNYSRGPVSINSAPDYYRRIKSVPTKGPNVLVLGSNILLPSDKNKIGVPALNYESNLNSGFPPVKSIPRASSPFPMVIPPSSRGKTQNIKVMKANRPLSLELVPSAKRGQPSAKSLPVQTDMARKTYTTHPPVYPHVMQDGNRFEKLTDLPKPRMLVSRGDAPWVYRHKVKRSMNELSKIMASKTPVRNDHPSL